MQQPMNRNTLQKQKGCFNPARLPQLQLHCQGMYLQADKLTTTSLTFQAEDKQLSQVPRAIVTGIAT